MLKVPRARARDRDEDDQHLPLRGEEDLALQVRHCTVLYRTVLYCTAGPSPGQTARRSPGTSAGEYDIPTETIFYNTPFLHVDILHVIGALLYSVIV